MTQVRVHRQPLSRRSLLAGSASLAGAAALSTSAVRAQQNANLGTPADFTARAAFAKNFFEAGGIEATRNEGFAARDEMVAAFRASGAKLACLCSSDKVYETAASSAARALSAAGARRMYLAGRGGRLEAALKDAGVGDFIYSGCDAVALLTEAHRVLADL